MSHSGYGYLLMISRYPRKENDAREVQDDQKCKFMSIGREKNYHRCYMIFDNKKIYHEETTAEKNIG